jgi:DNA (cytosine-5)-methyltransferase 1
MDEMKKQYTFIDLFAGCGGLSEGFLETGHYKALAHVEWELPMVETLRNRLVQKWGHTQEDAQKRVILFDVQKADELIHGDWSDESKAKYSGNNHTILEEKGLDGVIGGENVDLVIGGPPCQAYSIAGRAQDPNSMKDDYRNYLFESFVKIVSYYKPKLFVFENVPGLLSACPGDKPVRIRIYEAFKSIGYDIRKPENLKKSIYCAEDFGVPQKRNRIIIIGTRQNSEINFDDFYQGITNRKCKGGHKTVKDAIGNLPPLLPLQQVIKEGRCNVSHQQLSGEHIDLHIARYNGKRDQRLFKEWISKGMNNFSQQDKMDFYTKITGHTSKHIKYRNLEWDKPSPTVVAHLYKDGYMFIHPDIEQLRTITIREAALLQSFPLDFKFTASNASCYKMIGNAVPVLFAKGIANGIYDVLKQKEK